MKGQSDDRFLRLSAVLDRTALTRPTLYRLVQDGKFPKQIHIGPGCVAWLESDVHNWMSERIAASRNPSISRA
jgi:prophage regulatory protein